jgi:hypothetical protein
MREGERGVLRLRGRRFFWEDEPLATVWGRGGGHWTFMDVRDRLSRGWGGGGREKGTGGRLILD